MNSLKSLLVQYQSIVIPHKPGTGGTSLLYSILRDVSDDAVPQAMLWTGDGPAGLLCSLSHDHPGWVFEPPQPTKGPDASQAIAYLQALPDDFLIVWDDMPHWPWESIIAALANRRFIATVHSAFHHFGSAIVVVPPDHHSIQDSKNPLCTDYVLTDGHTSRGLQPLN